MRKSKAEIRDVLIRINIYLIFLISFLLFALSVVVVISGCSKSRTEKENKPVRSSYTLAAGVDAGTGDCCDNMSCWSKDTPSLPGDRPSWCDGFYQCNCWGGCQYFEPHTLPDGGTGSVCPRLEGNPSHTKCCEGDYPLDPAGSGYCVAPGTSCLQPGPDGGSIPVDECDTKPDGTFCNDSDSDDLCTGVCIDEACENVIRTAVATCCADTTHCYDNNDYMSDPPSCQQPGCNAGHRCVYVDSPPGTSCELGAGGECYDGTCEFVDGGLFVCKPLYHEDAYDSCEKGPGDMGTLSAFDEDGDFLEVFGSNRCTENDYNAATGPNCNEKAGSGGGTIPLGLYGHDVVYTFTIEETEDEHQLYSYIVKLESGFDGVVYLKTDEPCGDSDVRSCYYPGRDYQVVLEDECHSNDVMKCAGYPEYGCFEYCTRDYNGGIWHYPPLPYNCDSEYYGQVAVATIYPGGSFISPRTFYVFVDSHSSDQQGGEFRLTVTKQHSPNNPCSMPRDNPRVMDITEGGVFYGSVHDYVNSVPEPCEEVWSCESGDDCMCGVYENDPEAWAGKSILEFTLGTGCSGSDVRSCHAPGALVADSYNENPAPSAFWPAQATYKIDRSDTSMGSQTYCLYLEHDHSQYIDGIIDVWKRDPERPYGICDAVYTYGTCTAGPGHGFSEQGRLEVTVQAGEFWLVNVSEYAPHDDGAGGHRPCLDSLDPTCSYVLHVVAGSCNCSMTDMEYDYPIQPPAGNAYLLTTGNDMWIPASSGSGCDGTHCFNINVLSGNEHTSASGGGWQAWAGMDHTLKVFNSSATDGEWDLYVYHWSYPADSEDAGPSSPKKERAGVAVYDCDGLELYWAKANASTQDSNCDGLSEPDSGKKNKCVYTRLNKVPVPAGQEIYIVVDTIGDGDYLGDYRIFLEAS